MGDYGEAINDVMNEMACTFENEFDYTKEATMLRECSQNLPGLPHCMVGADGMRMAQNATDNECTFRCLLMLCIQPRKGALCALAS